MLTSDQTTRIADAILCLRSDWTKPMVLGVLNNATVTSRPARDVAIAFTACATDPATNHPNRLLERGPWWQLVKWTNDEAPTYRYANPRDCRTCNRPENQCIRDGHEYAPAFNGHDRSTPEQRAAVKATAQQLARPLPTIETTTEEN